MPDLPGSADPWPIEASTAELRAHRVLFYLIVVPTLGLWLPYIMFHLGVAVLLTAALNSVGRASVFDVSDGTWVSILSAGVPLLALAAGLVRERRRGRDDDDAARASEIPLPGKQGRQLLDIVGSAWARLQGSTRPTPRLILQPNLDVTAHAYDDAQGQAIEVSAGMARRAVRGDPLALSVLRHEIAHLVHGDLPAIRREALAVGASLFATRAAAATCAAALLGLILAADLGKFPVEPTLANVIEVHVAMLVAAVLVTLPLLLGPYLLRRYAGFLVALAETRADASAGLWGEGLAAFSAQVEGDPGVRFAPTRDIGLAYLSPSLSHLPAQDRVALLRDPERLATPKLRYFAVAVGAVWLLTFHQGDAIWDFALLVATVALLQAVTVRMAVAARGSVSLSARRAVTLAAGLLAAQALPLISIEGLAYLAQHLTMAIVRPGGFGAAEGVDYIQDTVDTFREFGGHVSAATGGPWLLLSVALAAGALAILFRILTGGAARRAPLQSVALPVAAFAISVAVSYRFFQESLYWPVRTAAFRWSPGEEAVARVWWENPVSALQRWIDVGLWYSSEFLHGPPILGSLPWLKLALPQLLVLAAALLGLSLRRQRFDVPRGTGSPGTGA